MNAAASAPAKNGIPTWTKWALGIMAAIVVAVSTWLGRDYMDGRDWRLIAKEQIAVNTEAIADNRATIKMLAEGLTLIRTELQQQTLLLRQTQQLIAEGAKERKGLDERLRTLEISIRELQKDVSELNKAIRDRGP